MAKGFFAKDQIKSIVSRIEKLEEEKKVIADDVRDIFAEARGNGLDVKALRTIIKMRKQDADERREQEEIVDLYLNALGMLPLFEHRDTSAGFAATKVTISSGDSTVETTAGAISDAGAALKTPAGKKALRAAAKKSGVGEIMRAG